MSDDWQKNLDEFAKADGFTDWNDLIEWFSSTHELPFKGALIKWSLNDAV